MVRCHLSDLTNFQLIRRINSPPVYAAVPPPWRQLNGGRSAMLSVFTNVCTNGPMSPDGTVWPHYQRAPIISVGSSCKSANVGLADTAFWRAMRANFRYAASQADSVLVVWDKGPIDC